MTEPTPLDNKVLNRANSLVFRWVGPAIGTLALACAGWAHGKISTDSDAIVRHEQQLRALEDQHHENDERFQRIEEKLDHILERLTK